MTREALAVTRAAPAAGRVGAGTELNRRVNELVAFYVRRLSHEEATALPATQAHFSDDDLAATQGEMIGSIPLNRYGGWIRSMLPALDRAELTGLFGEMTASAPAAALESMKAPAAGALEPERRAAVSRAAGLCSTRIYFAGRAIAALPNSTTSATF